MKAIAYLTALMFLSVASAQVFLPHRHSTGTTKVGLTPSTLPSDLVAYWKMNETSGTRVDCWSTNDLNEFTATSYTNGINTNAAYFVNAGTNFLSCPNESLSTETNKFSISAWIKVLDNSKNQVIFSKGPTNALEFQLMYLAGGTNKLRLYFGRTNANQTLTHSGSLATNTWYYVVLCQDSLSNNIITLQVNAGFVEAANFSGGGYNSHAPFYVGSDGLTAATAFSGMVDEVGYWTRILSYDERVELYNDGIGKTGCPFADVTEAMLVSGLKAYWNLDETSGARSDAVSTNTLSGTNSVGYGTGKIGNAALFVAANNDYLSSSNSVFNRGDQTYSWSVWYKMISYPPTNHTATVIGKDVNTGTGREYVLTARYQVAAGNGMWSVFKPVNTEVDFSLGAKVTNTWYHVVIARDALCNRLETYVNGSFVGNITLPLQATTTPLKLGRRDYAGFIDPLDGLIDEVGFWDRYLSPTDAANLYNGGSGKTYPFTP